MQKKWLLITGTLLITIFASTSVAFSASQKACHKSEASYKSTVKTTSTKSKIEPGILMSSGITYDIMYFKGSGTHWTGELRVMQEGDKTKGELSVLRSFSGFEEKTFKYAVETKADYSTGAIEFKNGGMYTIPMPANIDKDETVKVILEWGNKTETLQLTNKITSNVLRPEKVLELFKDKYPNVKDISNIRFEDFRKRTWYISFWIANDIGGSNGGVELDAVTGEFGQSTYTN